VKHSRLTTGLTSLASILQLALLAFLLSSVYSLRAELREVKARLLVLTKPYVPAQPVTVRLRPAAGAPALGPPEARVVMTVFSEFECGYCKEFAQTILPRLRKDYVETGKLKIIFRDLPLEMHTKAQAAAEAAACAHEQGRFWAMHDYLFANQQHLAAPTYRAWAGANGLDTLRYGQCLRRHPYRPAIAANVEAARAVGIQGTPAIVINNQLTMGIRPYEYFARAIDRELAAARP
jgi:protein-disulfide isomerase